MRQMHLLRGKRLMRGTMNPNLTVYEGCLCVERHRRRSTRRERACDGKTGVARIQQCRAIATTEDCEGYVEIVWEPMQQMRRFCVSLGRKAEGGGRGNEVAKGESNPRVSRRDKIA